MTSLLNLKEKTFIKKVTHKQFFKIMISTVFYFSNSYKKYDIDDWDLSKFLLKEIHLENKCI